MESVTETPQLRGCFLALCLQYLSESIQQNGIPSLHYDLRFLGVTVSIKYFVKRKIVMKGDLPVLCEATDEPVLGGHNKYLHIFELVETTTSLLHFAELLLEQL